MKVLIWNESALLLGGARGGYLRGIPFGMNDTNPWF
jgi:hypothetical protein